MSIIFIKFINFFALVLFLSSLNVQAFEPPPIFSDTTESGIEIYIVNIPQAKDVAIRVYSRGGAVSEDEFRGYGLAKAVQETLLLSMKNKWKKESEKIWIGKIDGHTDYDSVSFSAICPKTSFASAIEIIASTLSKPVFSDSLWQTTREKLSHNLTDQSKINALFQQITFAHTPLRYSVGGKLSLFLKLKKENLIDYYNKYFVAENIVVVIAGDINASMAKNNIADAFSFLSRKSASFKPEFKFPSQLTPHWFERHGDVTQSFACVGVKTFDKMNKAAFDVFLKTLKKNYVHSILTKQNDSVNSIKIEEYFFVRDRGAFAISFACSQKTVPRSAKVLGSWMTILKNFVWNENDIKLTAKKMIIGLMKKINNPDFVAFKVGSSIIKFNNPNYFFNIANQWQKISSSHIKKLCKNLFQPDKLNTVILSPDNFKDSNFLAKENKFLLDNERNLLGSVNYPVKYFKLKNNSLLILHKNPTAPLVRFNFSTIGGLWCETSLNNGIFAIIGEFMCKCSDNFHPDEFDEVCKKGAFVPNYFVNEQTFSLVGECLPQDASQAAQLLCSSWANPDFDEDFLYDVKESAIKKIELQSTNIADFADYSFRISMFEKLPYRLNKKGSSDFIKNVSIEQIETAYYDFISPPNTVITVSGNFDEKKIEKIIRKKLKKFNKKEKSERFVNNPNSFILNKNPPKLTALLQQENIFTSAVSRFYYSENPKSMIVCGIRTPGFNKTNFPNNIVAVFNAALLNELEKLKLNWTDVYLSEIISSYDISAFQGYNSGWIYAYLTVPAKFSVEAKDKLKTVFDSVLNMLADGVKLEQANARAKLQNSLSANYISNNKILSRNALFNLNFFETFDDFIKIDKNDFKRFRNIYGKFPLTVVVLPTK